MFIEHKLNYYVLMKFSADTRACVCAWTSVSAVACTEPCSFIIFAHITKIDLISRQNKRYHHHIYSLFTK